MNVDPEAERTRARIAEDVPGADLPSDAAVLVSGPPMTGKYELMLALLERHADGAIVISTKYGVERVREAYRAIAGDVPDERIGVVDCVGRQGAVDRDGDATAVRYVDSPGDLTRIGVEFVDLFEERYGEADVGVGVHSLSQLLMHTDVKAVYQFLQVLLGQVRSAGWFTAAVVDASVADPEEITTLRQHFDGEVRTRENDDGRREFRVRGVSPTPSDWTAF